MNVCSNCGQANNSESQFCRFCGTRMTDPQNFAPSDAYVPQQEYQQPRPYSWKTDEFQTQSDPRKKRLDIAGSYGSQTGNAPFPAQYTGQGMMQGNYRCPACGSRFLPRTERRISTGGWITFAVLMVAFFPLFWIGLLIKEDVHMCPSCNFRVR